MKINLNSKTKKNHESINFVHNKYEKIIFKIKIKNKYFILTQY